MTFTESVKSTLTKNYAQFSGRASRSEYWWFQLFYAILVIVLELISGAAASAGSSSISIILMILLVIVYLALILPLLGLAVRRLHDRDMSGWMILLGCIPIANIALLVFLCQKGTTGPNRFGPDPLQPNSTADVFA